MANVGILSERKVDENRVAIRPDQIKKILDRGHAVFVESGCGVNSGYSDDEYAKAGATVTDKREVLSSCQLIVKVKAPLEDEYDDYGPDHTLFCYLHFDENIEREKILRLINKGFLGIAFEWVEKDKTFPLLEPMSRLTGYLFGMKSSELLSRYKGVMPGSHEKMIPGANVLLLGAGIIGISALKYFMDIRSNIILLDKNPESLNQRINYRLDTRDIDYIGKNRISVIRFDNENPYPSRKEIEPFMPMIDITICCAVRRPDLPKSNFDYIISEGMVKEMSQNSVLCDATACVRDFIETAEPHEQIHHFYKTHGVIHYNCDHIPSMVGRTATNLLSDAILPYVLELADKGTKIAVMENAAIASGVNCYKGVLTLKRAADKKNIPFRPITDLL